MIITREQFRKDPVGVLSASEKEKVEVIDEDGKCPPLILSSPQWNDDEILSIGNYLSNICYNLSQQEGKTLTKEDCQLMKKFVKQWDEVTKKW